MSIPGLFYGQAHAGGLLAVGSGYTDAGVAYIARAKSNPVLPGGPEGEAIFSAVYLACTHRIEPVGMEAYDEVEVTVKAVVDEAEVATAQFTIRMRQVTDPATPPPRVRRTYELGFSVPHIVGGVEWGRFPPRGTNFQLLVEWPGSDVSVDGGRVEHEVVSEIRQISNP